jgi:hypothetical protein
MCNFDDDTFLLQETQVALNEFLKNCHEGVGGLPVDVVSEAVGFGGIESKPVGAIGVGGLVGNLVGVGGIPGKIPGGVIGGKGVELNKEHGGKVRRIEAGGRNGGIGADSSAETVGMKDVAGNGFGGVVVTEERIQERDGGLKGRCCGGRSHIETFLKLIVDKRCMSKSLRERRHDNDGER